MAVSPIPEGLHSVTPHLTVTGVPRLIEFLKRAFDAKEVMRHADPGGQIMHAQVKIGDSIVMMGEASGEMKPMPGALCLYVADTDATYRRALRAGGTSLREPADQFYGDRSAGVSDPSGNHWWICTHIEDVSPQELQRRSAALAKKSG